MAHSDSDVMQRVRAMVESGAYREALDVMRPLCEAEPYDPEIWLDMAEIARAAGMVAAAVSALFHVADLYARAGMAESADIAEDVLSLDPTHMGARQIVTMFKGRHLSVTAPDQAARISGVIDDNAVLLGESPRSDVPGQDTSPDTGPDTGPDTAHDEGHDEGRDAGQGRGLDPDAPSVSGMRSSQIILGASEVPGDEPFTIARTDRAAAHEPSQAPDESHEQIVMSLLASTSSRFLDALDQRTVRALVQSSTMQHFHMGQIIFRQGEPGDRLYLILEGGVDVERLDKTGSVRKLATLEPGAFFGEMAIMANAPRSATVRARNDANLLCLSREDVERLSERDPGVRDLLMRFFRARMVGTLMATSPLFTSLSVGDRRSLVGYFRMREIKPGQVVLEQSRESDGLYLVLVGKLGVYIRDDQGEERELGTLISGDVFGEMSFITGEPVMASIVTIENSWLLRLPREDLDRLVLSHPRILEQLSEIARLRQSRNRRTLDTALDTGMDTALDTATSPESE